MTSECQYISCRLIANNEALLSGRTGEVHVGRLVGPGPEYERARLVIEGVIGDVDLTHGFEGATRLPSDGAVMVQDGPEVAIAFINPLSSACKKVTSITSGHEQLRQQKPNTTIWENMCTYYL